MSANHPREALSAYLDGELSGEERSQLEQHLRDCAGCTALLADLELLARTAAEEQVPPAPADLSARIMTHIPRGVVERRRHWIHRIPMAAAASLAAAALLWVVFRSAPPPLSDPEFGRDMVSRESQPPQGAAGALGSASETEETFRQEAKKSELNEEAGRLEPVSTPAENSRQRVPALESVPESTRKADKVAALPSAATALDSVAKQNVPMEERLVVADMSVSSPTLVLREAGREIRLTDTGLLTVHAPEYDCTILLLPGEDDADSPVDEGSLQRRFADSRDLPVAEEIRSLFQDGFVGGKPDDEKRKVEHAQARRVEEQQELPSWTLVMERAGGAQRMDSGGQAAGIRSRLQSLVQERYRPRLEAQCGRLPGPKEEAGQNP